jgi:hypothetical protein
MKNNRLLIVFLIAALMLACNIPTGAATKSTQTPVVIEATSASAPLEEPTSEETATETLTPLPSETPTITPTTTPFTPVVTPLEEAVNCRFGPSTNFEQTAALLVGAYARILAKSNDGAWWEVQDPNGGSEKCWVSATVVVASGTLSDIPVAAAPAALITDVKLQVKPNSVNLGVGCPGPAPVFALKGTIHVNGPLEIKWHIETQKDGSQPEHTISFLKFGDKDVTFNYVPTSWEKGSYWVRVVITSPKSMFDEAKYEIKCS